MTEKTILGKVKTLRSTDFELGHLSEKFGKITFIDSEEKKDQNGQVSHLLIHVKTENQSKPLQVKVTSNEENVKVMSACEFGAEIDFTDCVIGHYVTGSGNFSQVAQSYKANKMERHNNPKPRSNG